MPCLGDRDHPAIDEVRDARDHALRRLTHAGRPVLPHQVEVPTDPAGCDDHRLSVELEVVDLDA